jgi:hypothetical protein
MKHLLLIAAVITCSTVYSQQVISYSKEEKCYLDEKSKPCKPNDEEKAGFINIFTSENFQDTINISQAKLITPPLQWGRNISDNTFGEIIYYNSLKSGFITNLSLNKLLPNHAYELTLNGNPKLVGNDLLPDTVPNLNIERYYDFLSITTDSHGEYHAKIGVYLKHGDYHVRFYVKDKDDFKIILYHDYFKFSVK